MESAEKEIVKTLELLGLLPDLIKGNVLKEENGDVICINNPMLDTFAKIDVKDPNEQTKMK